MGCDIYVYTLLQIIHKTGVAYIELACNKRYILYYTDCDDEGDKRTDKQQQDYDDEFLIPDFIDSFELPTLIYEIDSIQDEYTVQGYTMDNFIITNKCEKYNSLLDEKILNKTRDYINEDDADFDENDRQYNIVEKGLFKSKDDIITIHKIIQKKWRS